MSEEYVPGFAEDAVSMMSARTVHTHASFLLPSLRPDALVLDVGCGPGSITSGLGTMAGRVLGVDREPGQLELARTATRRPSRSTVDFAVADAEALPLRDSCVDAIFAHALVEHLGRPDAALAEFARVLRPGGVLAVSTSDWSRARLRPATANVVAALRGHYLLRRRAGGDPFAGRHLVDRVRQAGFADVRSKVRYRQDMGYEDLARYVESRLVSALSSADGDREQLASAARSAWVWARAGRGDFEQCWVEVLATR
ncbi:class I SAM-dependent methyltransferase [Amycolatopsis antarctica]|uniref:class I SAM-dependent methyltransferase n=1 Tax=Amycolatopsis antarctica TaxID=1854586 RepID=UPI0013FDAD57|nr:class I SAM-dependent methyltransferase [Amycolatopsis antarctica]